MRFFRSGWFVCRWCAHCLGSFLLWSVWLLLCALLVLQTIIAVSQELRVPTRVVRSFEDHLAIAGVRISFDSARFDAQGHVSVENLRVFTDSFDEPLALARSVLLRFDTWALTVGAFDVESIVAHDAQFFVPPMLSPTGQSEAVASDVDLALDLDEDRLTLKRLTGHAGKLVVGAHGGIRLPPPRRDREMEPGEALSLGIGRYLQVARQIALWQARLESFEHPALQLTLTEDEFRGARIAAEFSAKSIDLPPDVLGAQNVPGKVALGSTRLRTQFPLRPGARTAFEIIGETEKIDWEKRFGAQEIKVRFNGALQTQPLKLQPGELRLSSRSARTPEFLVADTTVQVNAASETDLHARLSSTFAGATWAVEARGDPKRGSAHVAVTGEIFRPLLQEVGDRIGRDLNALLIPEAPARVALDASLADGWKLQQAQGRLAVGKVNVRDVLLDGASANFSYRGTEVEVTDIVLAQGESIARGSYSMDTVSRDFRFLLQGRLRPIGISGWFGTWWQRFWENFDFSSAAPAADVDVQGQWRFPHLTTVFVGVDGTKPAIRDVRFDRVQTTLFIRPEFYDALELIAHLDGGVAAGRFTHAVDLGKPGFLWTDFDVDTNLELHESARVFGPVGLDIVSPFKFATPPKLKIKGRMDGASDGGIAAQDIDIQVESTGAFELYGFPLSDLVSTAKVKDRDIHLPKIQVGFAGGRAEGTAILEGQDAARTLFFDASLKDANLGQSIRILEEFGAKRRGEVAPPQSRFQQRNAAGKLDLKARAKGFYEDPYSYEGAGTATVTGAELAEVNLLGALSQALRGNSVLGFTSWSLDTGEASFTIERERLVFSEMLITGPSAKLAAHGYYLLDEKAINFNAKFYPFEKGKTLLANAVDLMLTPVSAALELKLSGSLDNPRWYFAYGPTGIIRKLAGRDDEATPVEPEKHRGPPPMLRR